MFPTAEPDGSVSLLEIQRQVANDNERIQVGETVMGDVALRKYIESLGENFRGKPYSKRQANNLLGIASFIREHKFAKGNIILYEACSSLDAFIEHMCKSVKEHHRAALEKARALKKDLNNG
jgi:hypothetical protein